MKEISIDSWDSVALGSLLLSELGSLGSCYVVARTFQRVTFDGIEIDDATEVDSLETFRKTGTDRRDNAMVWNVENFDYEHDVNPVGKRPNELIYAFLVDLSGSSPRVAIADGKGGSAWRPIEEIVQGLSELDAMAVYDYRMLNRVSPNEYWFKSEPLDAALLLIIPKLSGQ